MAIINSVLSWIMQQRGPQIELFKKHPHDVQNDWLSYLLKMGKDTEWGRHYDFRSIHSAQEFRTRIPLQNYESLQPLINRMMQGEHDILWPGEISWYAKSSGTTNDKSKFIPVSEEALADCHFKGGKDLLSMYFQNRPHSQFFTGKGLVLGGSHQVSQLNPESYYGDLSAVLIENLPFWAQYYKVPHRSIALMNEWELKLDRMTAATLKMNITSISGVPTWTLLLIKKILAHTGASNLLEVWPNLEVYFHGAVSFTPYREQFRQLIPSDSMYYMETYNASEGFFGLQDQAGSDEMLLMLDYGIYYEFIPLENLHAGNDQAIGLESVELNKNYALVISTNSGLWRYLIGDTVIFTSLYPYRMQISGRTRHYINAFGEELMIDNAEKALVYACEHTQALVRDYTAAPVYYSDKESGCHEWMIEFEKHPVSLTLFTALLDQELQRLNSDYEAKRYKGMALKMPIVHSVAEGTFYNWLKSKSKLGGQHKVPRLSNTRLYLEEILALDPNCLRETFATTQKQAPEEQTAC